MSNCSAAAVDIFPVTNYARAGSRIIHFPIPVITQPSSHSRRSFVVLAAILLLLTAFVVSGLAGDASAKAKKTISISKKTQQSKKKLLSTMKKRRANIHKSKSILGYFRYLSSAGRTVKKNGSNYLSPAKLYARRTENALPFIPAALAAQTLNIEAPAPADDPVAMPVEPVEIPKEEWLADAPRGPLYVQANWYCSAAGTTLSFIQPDATLQSLGFFTGDCTNVNYIWIGDFYPQKLGTFDGTEPRFEIDSTYTEDIQHTSDETGMCDIAYYKSAGDKDVYAAQYTCDEGFFIGPRNDIQFTVFAFPSTWTEPSETALKSLVADKDDDGMIRRLEDQIGTDSAQADTDADGLNDGNEYYAYLTNPLAKDTDGDGSDDKTEVDSNMNPLGPGKATAEQLERWSRLQYKGAPELSNITVTSQSGSATVSWDLNIAADGIVNYGPTTAYGTHYSDYAYTKSHAIQIPVTAGTTYHYAIRSCSTGPNAVCTSTEDATFVAQ